GWDTLDELLAQYHDFDIFTDDSLKVKHLRPTGKAYNAKAKLLQGEAMYTMGYGYWITFIASLKMAWKLKKRNAFFDNMEGFYNARESQKPLLVTKDEADFIRKYRWQSIKKKLF
ncbi:MAG: glycosyltransferase family 2 protein, partial [Aurantibacter sp.]